MPDGFLPRGCRVHGISGAPSLLALSCSPPARPAGVAVLFLPGGSRVFRAGSLCWSQVRPALASFGGQDRVQVGAARTPHSRPSRPPARLLGQVHLPALPAAGAPRPAPPCRAVPLWPRFPCQTLKTRPFQAGNTTWHMKASSQGFLAKEAPGPSSCPGRSQGRRPGLTPSVAGRKVGGGGLALPGAGTAVMAPGQERCRAPTRRTAARRAAAKASVEEDAGGWTQPAPPPHPHEGGEEKEAQ